MNHENVQSMLELVTRDLQKYVKGHGRYCSPDNRSLYTEDNFVRVERREEDIRFLLNIRGYSSVVTEETKRFDFPLKEYRQEWIESVVWKICEEILLEALENIMVQMHQERSHAVRHGSR